MIKNILCCLGGIGLLGLFVLTLESVFIIGSVGLLIFGIGGLLSND